MNSPLPPQLQTPMAEQMDLVTRPTPDHRKQAFSQIGNSPSWPTPPTELDHDFALLSFDMAEDNTAQSLPSIKSLGGNATRVPPLQSPPASPVQGYSNLLPPMHSPAQAIDQQLPPLSDAQLFSESHNESSQLPLFANQSAEDGRADSLSPVGRQVTPKPIPAEPAAEPKCTWKGIYSIFPHFQSVDRDFFRRYRQSCYADVKRIPAWRPIERAPTPPAILPATYWNAALGPKSTRTSRVTKPRDRSPAARSMQPKKKAAAPVVPRDSPALSPVVAKAKPIERKRERQTASAEPAQRKRAPPSKAVIVDDWQQIPDYAPPTSTLNATNRLKVTWKGVANDLSGDPEAAQLHPQEVEVAQTLKLPASQYIANKRRIFEARVKSIKDHKNFTKTAAQQACNIDVNKTSQLFEAYTRVGWFDEALFQQFLV